MQQIADWLEKLGMSEYAERFAESDIDTSVLRDLSDQDLKELGVSLGHRRKMLRAIAVAGDTTPLSSSTGRGYSSLSDIWAGRRRFARAPRLHCCCSVRLALPLANEPDRAHLPSRLR
jgi:hypothetical protein